MTLLFGKDKEAVKCHPGGATETTMTTRSPDAQGNTGWANSFEPVFVILDPKIDIVFF